MNVTLALFVLAVVLVILLALLWRDVRHYRPRSRGRSAAELVDDYRTFTLQSMAKNATVVEAQQPVFANGDIGKPLFIPRALSGNVELLTRIVGVMDSYRVEVADKATRNTGIAYGEKGNQVLGYFGTDNAPALQAMFDVGKVDLPRTRYGFLVEAPIFTGAMTRLRGDGLSLIKSGASLSYAGMPETRVNTTLVDPLASDSATGTVFRVADATMFPDGVAFSVWLGVTTGGDFTPTEQIRVRRIPDNTGLTLVARNASQTLSACAHSTGEEVRLSKPAAVFYLNQRPPMPGDYRSGVWVEQDDGDNPGTAIAAGSNVHLRGIVSDVFVDGLDVGTRQGDHVVNAFFALSASVWLDNVKCEAVWHGFDFDDYTDGNGVYRPVFTTRRDYQWDFRDPNARDIGSFYWQHAPGDNHVMFQPKGGLCPGQRVGTYSNCHGGTILSPVGGGFHFSRCVAMSIHGGHFECDQTNDNWPAITCRASDLTIRDTYWHDSELNEQGCPDQGFVMIDDDIGPSRLSLVGCASLFYIGNSMGGPNLPQERGWDIKIRRPHRDTRLTVRDFRAHTNSRNFSGRGGYYTDHVVIEVDTETGTDDQVALALALEQALIDASATVQGGNFDVRYWSGMWLVSSSLQGVEYRPTMITPTLSDISYDTNVMGRLVNGHKYRYVVAAFDDSGLNTAASNLLTSPTVKCKEDQGAQIALRVQCDHAPTRLYVWREDAETFTAPFTPSAFAEVPFGSADSYLFDQGTSVNGVLYSAVDIPELPSEATSENHQAVKNAEVNAQ